MTVISRSVSVERNRLKFASAHMATFLGECEPLHGHNYQLIVQADGELTEDSWVWDFGGLKKAALAIADELDHKFLLQMDSPLLNIESDSGQYTVSFGGRRYVFPASDVAPLPIDNTTAERLAEYIGGRLLGSLREAGADLVSQLRIGVEEMPGQAGWCTLIP
jgi:6-pyruvoyltetrahydropterin/6-carboxytetrahydropterin synthase